MGRRNGNKKFCHRKSSAGNWAEELQGELKKEALPEGFCAYCGRPLRSGRWHWMYDEFGQLVRKCDDSRSCYEKMGENNQKSLKKALRRFGGKEGI